MSANIHHFRENTGNGRPARYRRNNTGVPPVSPARDAFSLIEILVAMAVLAMLMTFMFSMVGGTSRLWERGNAKIEAAQAARVGLNRMAEDLESALSTTAVSFDPSKTSIAPFFASSAPDTREQASSDVANGSDQVFGVRLTGDPTSPFREFGYLCVYINAPGGWGSMRGNRYFLVQHRVLPQSAAFFRQSSGWVPSVAGVSNRLPLMDNCVRLELEYANTNGGSLNWTKSWTGQTNLPAGVLATVIVIDSRTAERIAQINGNSALSAADIDSITNTTDPQPGIQSLLRSGSIVMRRFIPFRNANANFQ